MYLFTKLKQLLTKKFEIVMFAKQIIFCYFVVTNKQAVMNNMLLLFAAIVLNNVYMMAQEAPNKSNLPAATKPETIYMQATKFTHRLPGTVGAAYHGDDLAGMPTRSITKIASLTRGVDYNNGGLPVIRGAKDGTAIFVDGVRVRSGALGIAGFSW